MHEAVAEPRWVAPAAALVTVLARAGRCDEAERAMEGAKRAGKGRSMSFTEVVNGPRQTAPSTIDWNELARTAPAEPIAPVIDTTPTEADE